jgi:hypothetical protein
MYSRLTGLRHLLWLTTFEQFFFLAQDEIWFTGSVGMNDGGLIFVGAVIVGAVIVWCWGVSTMVIAWL